MDSSTSTIALLVTRPWPSKKTWTLIWLESHIMRSPRKSTGLPGAPRIFSTSATVIPSRILGTFVESTPGWKCSDQMTQASTMSSTAGNANRSRPRRVIGEVLARAGPAEIVAHAARKSGTPGCYRPKRRRSRSNGFSRIRRTGTESKEVTRSSASNHTQIRTVSLIHCCGGGSQIHAPSTTRPRTGIVQCSF